MKNVLFIIALSLIVSACAKFEKKAPLPPVDPDYTYLERYASWLIKQQMRRNRITGLSIAVVDDQSVIWRAGFGFSDSKQGIPASENTVYRGGSIAKVMTAIAIMQLVENNQVDLDAPLSEYVEEFAIGNRFGSNKDITIRSMLTHHSGLPTDFIDQMWAAPQAEVASLVSRLNNEYTAFPVGQLFSYSNVAFSLLGEVVERVSGQTYESYIEANIFRPLSMFSSAASGVITDRNQVSNAYIKKREVPLLPTRDIAAAGIHSTVMDLSRFIQWVNRKTDAEDVNDILSEQSLAAMFRPQYENTPLDFTTRMGLGWRLYDNYLGQRKVVGHDGRTVAHSSLLLIDPEAKIGVVIMANSPSESGGVYRIGRDVLRKLYEIKTQSNIPWRPYITISNVESFPFSIEGSYATTLGLVTVLPKKEHRRSYKVKALGRTFRLVPDKDHEHVYRMKYKLFGLFPISLGWIGHLKIRPELVDGKQLLVGYSGAAKRMLGEKVPPADVSAVWQNRQGRYVPVNNLQPDIYKIKHIDLHYSTGYLTASVKMKAGDVVKYALKPVSNTQAVVSGLGRSLGATLFWDNLDNDGSMSSEDTIRYLGVRFKRK